MSLHDSSDWARAIRIADVLSHGSPRAVPDREPRLTVPVITRDVVLHGAPRERFSDKRPAFTPQAPEEEGWRPIDVLYGSYDPANSCIEIYIENVRRDAPLFGEFKDFLHIVRLHEYAHATVHLGISLHETVDVLDTRGSTGYTDWNHFLKARARAFAAMDDASHEYLAQAVTLAVIARLPDPNESERLMATFEALEKRQPPHYVLPSDIKLAIHMVDWRLVIAAARRDIDVFRARDFSLVAGLQALTRESISGPAEQLHEPEWVVPLQDPTALAQLKDMLWAAEPPQGEPSGDAFKLLVDRLGPLRIEIFAREHPPPHFRVLCGDESANYRIADCQQLNGGLRRYYRTVRDWHARNKATLIDAWNCQRPSDCPVGNYRHG